MDLYAENILDHFKHPRGKHAVTDPSAAHEEINLSCGDTVSISVRIDGETIADLGWEGAGCAISQAAMSLLAEALTGKTVHEIDMLTPSIVQELLGVPVSTRRIKCALLGLHALKNLLHAYRKEPQQGWAETVGDT